MVKRPPFEEANNYPLPPGKTTSQWIIIAIIIAAVTVIATFGYNYWDVGDWLVSVRKP